MEQMVFSENGEFVTIYLRISVVVKVGNRISLDSMTEERMRFDICEEC